MPSSLPPKRRPNRRFLILLPAPMKKSRMMILKVRLTSRLLLPPTSSCVSHFLDSLKSDRPEYSGSAKKAKVREEIKLEKKGKARDLIKKSTAKDKDLVGKEKSGKPFCLQLVSSSSSSASSSPVSSTVSSTRKPSASKAIFETRGEKSSSLSTVKREAQSTASHHAPEKTTPGSVSSSSKKTSGM